MLPPDVQADHPKPEKERTAAEQKIADDYFPVLRIDADKIQEVMPPEVRKKYKELQAQLNQAGGGGGGGAAAAACRRFGPWKWTGPAKRRRATSSPAAIPSGPRRTTRRARLAVRARRNRFPRRPHRSVLRLADRAGESAVRPRGRQPPLAVALRRRPAEEPQRLRQARRHARPIRSCSTGWPPSSSARKFSMKEMHRLIVTSETYKLASEADRTLMAANHKADPRRHLPLALPRCSGSKPSRSGIRSWPPPAIWI